MAATCASTASSLRVELSLIDARDFVSCPVALFPASSEREIADEKIPKDMLELASHIVETKSGHFKPEKFEDHYEDAIEVPRERAPAKVINLMPKRGRGAWWRWPPRGRAARTSISSDTEEGCTIERTQGTG